MHGEPKYKISNVSRSTQDRDGAIALDVQRGQMFGLNSVGSRILELLTAGSSELEIVNRISSEFNAQPDVVETDVREFVKTLSEHHLIEVDEPTARTSLE